MAEVLATMVVGPLLSMVKEKASSYLLDKYQVMEGMEEQHEVLKRKLPAILDVITDAEEQAAKHREGAKAWLEAVRKVAYKANDVLDEFKYEALRLKAKAEGHYKALGMHVIKLFPSQNRVVFRDRMAKRLCMILQEIDVLIAEMNAFRFEFKPQPPMPMQLRQTDACIPTDSVEIASKSRVQEKKELVGRLLAQASCELLTVLPIIGMGGLGKTTLAQLVYNDTEIQKYFELRLWVCVSDDFEVDSLAGRIVEAAANNGRQATASEKNGRQATSSQENGRQATASEENGHQATAKSALEKLQDAVSGKRYLLVLDDVWNRDEPRKWEKLKSYLQHGGSGSLVLTTTRDEAVAKLMMGTSTTEGAYTLESLGADFIEEIIKTRAFGSKQEEWPGDLVDMVGEVAKRRCGSPLAATALGSVLRTKTSKKEWEDVLNGSTICDEENGILPVLKLSYNCLPSYMRQCFAFCAMFPKDYEIDVQMLIHLWMANGFIPEQSKVCPETFGKRIFIVLKSRSFFQDVKNVPFDKKYSIYEEGNDHRYCSRITCKIHDLMHDVALSAMGEECAAIATQPSESEDVLRSVRHLYLSIRGPETLLNASLEKGFPAFQTLICDGYVKEHMKILSKYNSIRALKISRGSFLIRPKYLHHLRYLDLSKSYIRAIPKDITILYHLQTLDLSYCEYLERLLKELKYLTGLRHLYTHGCFSLKSMPAELGRLTSLQTLTYFVAGNDSGCSNVGELQNLDLGGTLKLSQLGNVTGADAQEAGLGNKKNLTELELRWTGCGQEAQNNHEQVVEGLKPHDGLKVMRIYSCGSSTSPTWMNTLKCMVELKLFGCKNLQKLPALWQLPALQILELWKLDSLHCLCSGGTAPVIFPELNVLILLEMANFEAIFPKVEELEIKECKSLTALPKAESVIISGVGTKCRSAFPTLRKMTLKRLTVFERWEAVEGNPGEDVSHVTFPLLETLSIEGCPKLTDLPEAPKLSELSIFGRGQQQISLEAAGRCIPSLSRLNLNVSAGDTETTLLHVKNKWNGTLSLAAMELRRCDIFFSSHSSALALWTCFAQLGDLTIWNCDALEYWPENVFQVLVCLRKLVIHGCRKLTGCTQVSDEQSAPAPERGGILPCLESLKIQYCESLAEVPNQLPASLRTLHIEGCYNLKSIVFRQEEDTRLVVSGEGVVQPDTSSLIPGCSCTEAIPSTAVLKLSSAANHRFLPFPCLESLNIQWCDGLSEVANLPPSIKTLAIYRCSNVQSLSGQLDAVQKLTIRSCSKLESLEPCLGDLPSLEELKLDDCERLVSLPDGPQAYSSLRVLRIEDCDGIKLLPPSLHSRLDCLEEKVLDARFEDLLEPKTRKCAIRSLVCLK